MKTKIYLTAAAVATLTLGSCSQDQVVEQSFDAQPKAIEFGVYNAKAPQTKAAELTDANFTQFGVTAFYTANKTWDDVDESATPNFMYNQAVNGTISNGTTSWTYAPVKYWPTQTTDNLSFFAYAPMSGTNVAITENTVTGSPVITYTMPTKSEDMDDFVADVQLDIKHGLSNVDDGATRTPVTFTMLHEMTRLALTATLDESFVTENEQSSTLVIKSIKFGKTGGFFYHSSGKYNFAQTMTDNNQTTNVDESRGKWTELATATEFDLNENILAFQRNKAWSNKVYGTESAPDWTIGLTTTDVINLVDGATVTQNAPIDDYLFLLPPNGETGLDAAKDIIIEYDIVTKDEKHLNDKYSCTSSVKTVQIPSGFLKQGVAYSLNFKFYIDAIELSANVQTWGTVVNGDINVPFSPDNANTSNP